DDAAVVDTAFQILEEWASALTLDPEEVDRERLVVIEEWRARRGAMARLIDEQYPVLLADSRYAVRSPIGELDVLQTFPHDALVRFYERWYRPDLMAVIAVGDFDPERIESIIRTRFGRLPPPPEPAGRPTFDVPMPDG